MEHAIETAKENENHAYPCFFRRVNTNIAGHRIQRPPPRRRESAGTRDIWSPHGMYAWEATDDVQPIEPNDFTKWADQAPLCVSSV